LLIFLLRVTVELKLELLPKQTSQHTSYVSIRQHSSEYVSIRDSLTIELKLTLLHKQTARHVYSVERYVCYERDMCATREICVLRERYVCYERWPSDIHSKH
jgi:hypothetical protein